MYKFNVLNKPKLKLKLSSTLTIVSNCFRIINICRTFISNQEKKYNYVEKKDLVGTIVTAIELYFSVALCKNPSPE